MGIYEQITQALQAQQQSNGLLKQVQIERQDPAVAARETPEQTMQRIQAQQAPQQPQGYDSGQIPFTAPAQQIPQTPAIETLQKGNKPTVRAGWF